ncbi:MAG TPA: ABC transporter permease [Propionicimonas sp.]|uniref:ABC transporter permease n=1 Tax=Propionicimonas sp. TaxID=1955623 RepID=UPI002F3E6BF0
MKLLAVAGKTLREQARNPLLPLLAIGLGPFFVLMMWAFFPSGGSTTYPVVVVNSDAGATVGGASLRLGDRAVVGLGALTHDTGVPILDVRQVVDLGQARDELAAHRAVAFVEFPESFTRSLLAARAGTSAVPVRIGGDLGSPLYPVVAVVVADGLDRFARQETGRPALLELTEVPLGASGSRTEFELYVPGVLVFAIGLMMFAAATALAQETEAGTINRLVRTPMGAVGLLGGISVVQVLVGLAAGLVSLGTAVLLGFRSAGPLWLALPVWVLTSLSVIGLGLLVAAFTRSVAQAFLVANFPFGLFMFLSGTMFPVRGVPLFSVAGQEVNLLDVLPPRHAVNALTTVFSFGSTAIGYELVMLTVLSVGYFLLGAWAFHRRHLRVAS